MNGLEFEKMIEKMNAFHEKTGRLPRKSLIDLVDSGMVVEGKTYPNLPEKLKEFYVYTKDGGHSILGVPKEQALYGLSNHCLDDMEVPIPVKYVLEKDYDFFSYFLILEVPYDPITGLDIDEKYYEF